MYSVLLLIVSFGALAGLYVLLDAPFTAVTQIIVYAGAIMVLFLFVVMLLNVPREDEADRQRRIRSAPAAVRLGALLGSLLGVELVLGGVAASASAGRRSAPRPGRSARCASIGAALFTDYAFAFEATSMLILVAMVGAVVLAREAERVSADDHAEPLPGALGGPLRDRRRPASSCGATSSRCCCRSRSC